MPLSPVTSVHSLQSAAAAPPIRKQPPASTSDSTAKTQDTVHLSSAAQAQLSSMKAAVQEASETPAQTAREAQSGDLQAQRLLAREAAAAKAAKRA